jgi:L-ascorbate metabolism protein UlaG (beta-lactamase superfamily)
MDTLLYLLLIYLFTYFGLDRFLRAKGYRGDPRTHFDGERFVNIGGKPKYAPHARRPSMLKWLLSRPKNTWEWRVNSVGAKPRERVLGGELVVTMINHASVLIQTEGLNIITDPIWSKRTSPFQWIGPKRYRPAGITFADLPPIDIVLISHNHYDHMDIPTLRKLFKRDSPKIFVGLGNAHYLQKFGINAQDMDWWDKTELTHGLALVCSSGQHFSSRAMSDRNKTLWCGYILETKHGNIYFAGDTGYGPFLEQYKQRYQEFRLGLLPIGAYIPDFIMQHVHMSPSEAYKAAGEIGVKHMIPIHYGTFSLADDKKDQPLQDLARAEQESANGVDVIVLSNGESAQVE